MGAAVIAAYPFVHSLLSCRGSRAKKGQEAEENDALFFKISLAEWSLNRAIFGGQLDHLDFPLYAKENFGINAVEYVNQFFMDKATDQTYLGDMKSRCDDNGITSVLIMCDLEGDLGDADATKRKQAVENHYKWVEAAQFLGCHAIRVNAAGHGSAEDVARYAAGSLTALATFARDYGIAVIVENHGGYSSDGKWLSQVMREVDLPNCGTLPDIGNFCIKRSEPVEQTLEAYLNAECLEEYDRYQGTAELLPFAKGVSAKTYDFDADGNETSIDYRRILKSVKEAKFTGYVGIEYEGHRLSANEGILKTKTMLEQIGRSLT
ncbi:Sugar phosphate isomerase/epimerase [Parapedobacter indicus]|uniref:Sugar phosphate isomerase/epimerase n=2 Tax=Parapedobacter indicus TaxID=1477437 RepID=A0A1I3JA99_9SPHI|nr:sugar phosphate isomerase/epimerase family protein [Parapedobacter indicus]PPL02440.1 sugar phosphate isomerase/epimerase [Parapedobacter indicus]SFI56888.1 Sugar phosphate isomerase/epimerase [Parapedobacter indicus]